MRILSLTLSLLLHALVALFGVVHGDAMLAPDPPDQDVVQVSLVDAPPPKDLPPLEESELPDHLQPKPEPPPEQPPPEPQAGQAAPEQTPEPAPEPARPAPETPEAGPAAASPALEARWAGPEAGVPEGVEAISPVKRKRSAKPRANATQAAGKSAERVHLQQGHTVNVGGKNVTVKVGAVGRTLAALVEVDFDESDYAGHYVTTTGRTVLVMDGREVVDALVLQDPVSGVTRRLERTGINTFVFAYGPTFHRTEPAEGSLTFLPGDETYIHRFIWLPKGMAAEFPVKVRSRQRRVTYDSGGTQRTATLYLPPEAGEYPGVVLAAVRPCEPRALHASLGRMLAAHDVATLVPDGPLCGTPSEQWAELEPADAARDTWAAAARLSNVDEVSPGSVGVWGRGAKGLEAAAAMAGGRYLPFAVVSLSGPSQVAAAVQASRDLAGLGRASRVLVSAACRGGECGEAIAGLESACPGCAVEVAEPLCPGFRGLKAWLCHLSLHAETAGEWIGGE